MSSHPENIPPARRPWFSSFLGLLAISGLIAMPWLAGPPDPEKVPDIIRFLGRFHPVLLHLPIGVFALILIQELGAIFGKPSAQAPHTPLFPMFFGAASSILAVLAGFLLYHGEDYGDSGVISRHLWGGIIFACAAVLTWVVKCWTVTNAGNPALYRTLLFGSVGIMGLASHDGATITHGEGYLTQYAPQPVRQLLNLEEKKAKAPKIPVALATSPAVYPEIVAPILEKRCVECHKEGKAKGKLRMDTYEMLVKGGKEGPAFEPGDSSKSNIIIRAELPEDDEEHMPPEGKPDIEAHELAVVKWWIDHGADPTKKLADFEVPAPISEAIAKILPAAASGASSEAETSADTTQHIAPDAALQDSVLAISKEFPGAISFEFQGSSNIAFTAASLRLNFDDRGFEKLQSVLPFLVSLDLSATRVTDQSVARLAAAPNLRMLRLAETQISDAALDSLLTLKNLDSINLYGTKVTDAGILKLSALPNLKRLYLWQTTVTPDAIKQLKEKLPGCEVVAGTNS